jgi:hypothetical protein
MRHGLVSRMSWCALGLTAAAVLATARAITPSPSGLGSHLSLGLPPCAFLAWSALPCPTCGLTTAFAFAARLELARSLHAHPLGLPLFALALLMVPYALYAIARGHSLGAALARGQADRVALWLAIALLASWVARVVALTR